MVKYVLFTLLIFLVSCSSNKVCRNPQGNEVDWYTIFFMPASASLDGKIYYGYFDPTLSNLKYYSYSEYTFPPNFITQYAKTAGTDFNYFFWNDDKTIKDGEPIGASSSKAHAKGSLVYDMNNGAFLLHSLPRFPTRNARNDLLTELPSNGGLNGQTFLCITVDKNTAEQIAKLLDCINVSINKSINSDRVNRSPNEFVNDLINSRMNNACDQKHTVKIRSKGNKVFTFFGKNYRYKIIPYDTTLREVYYDDFYVRTWSRPALAPSLYETFNLVNVLDVKFGLYNFGINKEHSKWAVSKNKNIVCFSDLNHTESQKERGGHIVCFENQKLHKIMLNAIVRTDEDGNAQLRISPKMGELIKFAKKKIN
jgi:deoxyribonuclease-2